MKPFSLSRILFTTDLSDLSWKAWSSAVALADRWDSEVVVLHVDAPSDELDRNLQREVAISAIQHRIGEMEQSPRHPVKIVVAVTGDTEAELLRWIQDLGPDLVVTATHGRTGLEHALMGSTAEKLVRRSTAPVLSVRVRPLPDDLDVQADRIRIKKIIAPLEGR